MTTVAVLNQNQAKPVRDLHPAIADLHLNLSPLGKARAANMPQAGDAVANRADAEDKIVRAERRHLQGIARRGNTRRRRNRLKQGALAGNQLPGDVHFPRVELF